MALIKRPVAFTNLYAHLRADKLVTGRRDERRTGTPHVTIMWGTASGEFDVHLKYADDRYESLLRTNAERLFHPLIEPMKHFQADLEAFVRRCAKAYRPGWLGRNGYLIHWIPEPEYLAFIQEFAPVKRGRHRVDVGALEAEATARFSETLYGTGALHAVPRIDAERASSGRLQVGALCLARRRKKRGPDLMLNYDPERRRGGYWWGWPKEALSREMQASIIRNVLPILARARAEAERVLGRIQVAMRLDEVGIDLVPLGLDHAQ